MNGKGGYYDTPLSRAAKNNHVQCISVLLKVGADVNRRRGGTISLLTAATQDGHIAVVRLLISAGANVNKSCDRHGNRSLYWAVKNGHSECLSALLEAGASVNEATERGIFVPLTEALWNGHNDIVHMLIQVGADVNKRNTVGETAFISAAVEKRYEILKLLLSEGADVNAADSNGSTALIKVACRLDCQDLPMLRFLLRIGVKINFVGFRHLCGLSRLENPGRARNALMKCLRLRKESRESALLLFAAGETIDESALETVPEYLQPQKDINLMDICRGRIREHLLKLDPHAHLFHRVPRLALPATVTDFLVYNQILDDTQDNSEA